MNHQVHKVFNIVKLKCIIVRFCISRNSAQNGLLKYTFIIFLTSLTIHIEEFQGQNFSFRCLSLKQCVRLADIIMLTINAHKTSINCNEHKLFI